MSDCIDDYFACIDMLVDEYRALRQVDRDNELLKLIRLRSGGFTMTPKFSRTYPPNPSFRKGGTTQAVHQMWEYHQALEIEVARTLKGMIDKERGKYGSDAELACMPQEEKERINSELENKFKERGIISLVWAHFRKIEDGWDCPIKLIDV